MSARDRPRQEDLFAPGPAPVPRGMTHTGDPDTSRHAAERVSECLTQLQERVLRLLMDLGPMTDHELHAAYVHRYGPAAYVTPAKRRGELRDQGRVADTGERRIVPTTGSLAVVWKALE